MSYIDLVGCFICARPLMAQAEQKQESTIRENTEFIKEYIEEKLPIHVHDHYDVPVQYDMIQTIYVELLDNYTRCVSEVCKDKEVKVQSMSQDNLRKVWKTIEEILPVIEELRLSFGVNTNAYTFCKSSPDEAPGKWINLHLEMVYYIRRDNMRICPEQLTHLLSLSYWIFAFYSKKAELGHSNYSKISHYLHFDLLMTLITVKYLRCRNQGFYMYLSHRLPPLPAKLKIRNVVHYGITAEHPAFQRLILLNVLKILYNGATVKALTRAAPEHLASIVCQYFGKDGRSKGVDGLLRIVKDQSRYMTLTSPDLRRNYVSDKTRCVLSAIVRVYKLVTSESDDWEALSWACRIVKGGDYRDDGSYLPTSAEPPDMRIINRVHHQILYEVCKYILGDNCPPINNEGWITVEGFTSFITEIAFLVVNITRRQPPKNRPALYPAIGRIVVSLQEIIAARSYLSECKKTWTMAANREAIRHQKILFLFLAFRVILLYILPWKTGRYDVQQVADRLPIYAEIQKFNLPLHKLYEALRN